ncbi:hypothetical protein AB8Q19_00050 [Candidatus Profftella armatura]
MGGASLFPIPNIGHTYIPGMNFSSDGHCKAFDFSARWSCWRRGSCRNNG